ncbi:MAG TPA: hypothetical protein VL096_18080 [Pirellulaceae bacterium]|nr:hypothetical protein [Pirellulaceae bacterium]
MPEGTEPSLYVVLADEVTSGQIHVSIETFVDFCVRMEADLETLELRWQHLAAPNAGLLRRSKTL